jgi:hypothetical protein
LFDGFSAVFLSPFLEGAQKKKNNKSHKMAGEAIVELSTLRLPSFSRQAPKHSGFSYTKR